MKRRRRRREKAYMYYRGGGLHRFSPDKLLNKQRTPSIVATMHYVK
jgi:hypothetical protein